MCTIASQLCIQYKLHKRSQYSFPSPMSAANELLQPRCFGTSHQCSPKQNYLQSSMSIKSFFFRGFFFNEYHWHLHYHRHIILNQTHRDGGIDNFYRCFLYAYQIIRLTKQSRIQVIVWSSIGGHKMEHKQLHHTKLKKDKTRTLCKVERNLFQMENTFDIFCFFLREQYLK